MILYFTCLICIKELVPLTHLFLVILFKFSRQFKNNNQLFRLEKLLVSFTNKYFTV